MSDDETSEDTPRPDEEEFEATVEPAETSKLPVAPEARETRIDLLYRYIRDIQRHPLLTPEEEQRLTRQYTATKSRRTRISLALGLSILENRDGI